jgi:hypothetical protein
MYFRRQIGLAGCKNTSYICTVYSQVSILFGDVEGLRSDGSNCCGLMYVIGIDRSPRGTKSGEMVLKFLCATRWYRWKSSARCKFQQVYALQYRLTSPAGEQGVQAAFDHPAAD